MRTIWKSQKCIQLNREAVDAENSRLRKTYSNENITAVSALTALVNTDENIDFAKKPRVRAQDLFYGSRERAPLLNQKLHF